MPDHCPPVDVLDVASVVQSSWFIAALAGPGHTADAIVVLAHMDADDPLVEVIHSAIRCVMIATRAFCFDRSLGLVTFGGGGGGGGRPQQTAWRD